MERNSAPSEAGEDEMELPPGFRFHPTDEELITHYLSKKVLDAGFNSRAIAEVDLNKCEPWDLPHKTKLGEKELYLFCVRDRKYPTGLRTNRATAAGYWKATGKDKEIRRDKSLVGMKKTLVFYRGRAPKGEKTSWIMHEYRLEGSSCSVYSHARTSAQKDWVICRVFKKISTGNGKKAFGVVKVASFSSPSYGQDMMMNPNLLQLTDPHVTCFSNSAFQFSALNPSAGMSSFFFPKPIPPPSSIFSGDGGGFMSLLQPSRQGSRGKTELLSISQETALTADMNSFEDCLWNC